jgi:hydroxysqualene dehydroxylase
LEIKNNKAVKVITSKRTIEDFEFVISAIPWFALEKLEIFEINNQQVIQKFPAMPGEINLNFEHSSILTIHIYHSVFDSGSPSGNKILKWLQQLGFAGLIGSPVHWIFNHKDHLTLVISDANDLIDKPKEELFEMAAGELKKYTGLQKEDITSYKVIKEKRATFIPGKESLNIRRGAETKINNLLLAGDWVKNRAAFNN